MKKFVNAMTMMIRNEVGIERRSWCMILLVESKNYNEMTEKARTGNGAEVWELGKVILPRGKKNKILANTRLWKSRRHLELTEIWETKVQEYSLENERRKEHMKNRDVVRFRRIRVPIQKRWSQNGGRFSGIENARPGWKKEPRKK